MRDIINFFTTFFCGMVGMSFILGNDHWKVYLSIALLLISFKLTVYEHNK